MIDHTLPPNQLIRQYEEIINDLSTLYLELADAQVQSHQLRYNTIADHIGVEKSITALQEMGKLAAMIPQSSVYRIEGEIAAKLVEKEFVAWILDKMGNPVGSE